MHDRLRLHRRRQRAMHSRSNVRLYVRHLLRGQRLPATNAVHLPTGCTEQASQRVRNREQLRNGFGLWLWGLLLTFAFAEVQLLQLCASLLLPYATGRVYERQRLRGRFSPAGAEPLPIRHAESALEVRGHDLPFTVKRLDDTTDDPWSFQ
jgi:hypothetical protein